MFHHQENRHISNVVYDQYLLKFQGFFPFIHPGDMHTIHSNLDQENLRVHELNILFLLFELIISDMIALVEAILIIEGLFLI